jgi:hypothetical protein
LFDTDKNPLQPLVAQYVGGGYPQDPDAPSGQKPITALVMTYLRYRVVRKPVYLNRQTRGGAIEIEDVRSDWMLPAKAKARQSPLAQRLPEHDLRQAHFPAQFACSPKRCLRRPHAPSTMPRMVPLPRLAGEEQLYQFQPFAASLPASPPPMT